VAIEFERGCTDLEILRAIPLVLLTAAGWAQTPSRPEFTATLNEAGKMFAAGDFSGVISKLSPWTEEYPNLAEARHGLGLAYYQQQNFADTVRHITVAPQHEEKDSAVWHQTVENPRVPYYFTSRWPDAALLEQASAWSPGNATLLYTLDMSYVYRNDRDCHDRDHARGRPELAKQHMSIAEKLRKPAADPK